MRRLVPTLAFAVTVIGSGCSGYVADTSIAPGDRVRVTAPRMDLDGSAGTVDALEPDTLVVTIESRSDVLTVPLADVTSLEVHRGQKSLTGRGAAIGAGIGAGLGIAIGLLLCLSDDCYVDSNNITAVVAAVVGAGGALVGAGLGAIYGGTIRVDRWQNVPLDDIRVGWSPVMSDGVVISVALRL